MAVHSPLRQAKIQQAKQVQANKGDSNQQRDAKANDSKEGNAGLAGSEEVQAAAEVKAEETQESNDKAKEHANEIAEANNATSGFRRNK